MLLGMTETQLGRIEAQLRMTEAQLGRIEAPLGKTEAQLGRTGAQLGKTEIEILYCRRKRKDFRRQLVKGYLNSIVPLGMTEVLYCLRQKCQVGKRVQKLVRISSDKLGLKCTYWGKLLRPLRPRNYVACGRSKILRLDSLRPIFCKKSVKFTRSSQFNEFKTKSYPFESIEVRKIRTMAYVVKAKSLTSDSIDDNG